jgi:hypothetical protein
MPRRAMRKTVRAAFLAESALRMSAHEDVAEPLARAMA